MYKKMTKKAADARSKLSVKNYGFYISRTEQQAGKNQNRSAQSPSKQQSDKLIKQQKSSNQQQSQQNKTEANNRIYHGAAAGKNNFSTETLWNLKSPR